MIRRNQVDTYAGGEMKRLFRTTIITTFGVLALTACGQNAAQSQAETPAQIVHELVQCARTHGDPSLPDPVIDSRGRVTFPPGTPDIPPATKQACQSIADRLPASMRGDHPSAADIQMEIRFAQCMRTHGLPDWPDPDANGNYPLPPDLRTTTKSGPVWDRIHAGWDACRAFNTSGHISVSQG